MGLGLGLDVRLLENLLVKAAHRRRLHTLRVRVRVRVGVWRRRLHTLRVGVRVSIGARVEAPASA